MSDESQSAGVAGEVCLTLERLHALADGAQASEGEERHLASCSTCSASWRACLDDVRLASELAGALATTARSRSAGAGHDLPDIDGFEVRRELHRGAQGVVYEAWQHSTRRAVAIKTPTVPGPLSMKQMARFEREIELAASISHPAVVAIHASGLTSDGRPYIAMELVEGRTLDEHARLVRGDDSRAIRSLLSLFVDICRGVDAAHQRGIIHRDLKPANIVIDRKGRPRVLDFGVARLRDHQGQTVTREGDFVGTLAYAAPEQLSKSADEVGLRTDVYALGVIAYELVTGERPHAFDGSAAGLVRAIAELPPKPPTVRGRPIDQELRTVLLTALAKDPARRYASAGALAEDVTRYLAGRPLRARGDGVWYPVAMSLKRHPYVTGAAALAACAAIAAGVVMVRLQIRAREADQVKASAVEAILGTLAQTNRESTDRRAMVTTIPELLDQAASITRERLAAFPEERGRMIAMIAEAYASRGAADKAADLLDEEITRLSGERGESSLEVSKLRAKLGRVLWQREDRAMSRAQLERALAALRASVGEEHEDTLECMHRLAVVLIRDRDHDGAGRLVERVVEARERLLGPDDLTLAEARITLAATLRGRCRYEEAVALCMRVLEVLRRARGEDSREVATTLEHVVANLIMLKREAEAEPHAIEAVRIRGKWFQPGEMQYASGLMQLASVKRRLGADGGTPVQRAQLEEARDLARQVLAARLAFYTDRDHESLAEARSLLGQIELRLGALDEAEGLLRSSLEMRRRLGSKSGDDWVVARAESYLGECWARMGRVAEGEALLRGALAKFEASSECQARAELPLARERLADALAHAGRSDEAAVVRRGGP